MRGYKILGLIAGAHSCGTAYIDNGEIVAVIEEERINRVKSFQDYENNFDRFPYDSLHCLINRHNLVLSEVDYFTSFIPYEYVREMMIGISGFIIPENKYIRIDHHESHAALSYFLSGFEEDTLVFCADASGGNGYNSKSYLGKNGNLEYLDGITTKRKSLGHFYAALTEIVGFKRLKDEGKIVGLSGHGKIWENLYDAWESVIRIEDTKTDTDTHSIEAGQLYSDLYNKFFSVVGSKYWKNKGAIEDIAYTGQVIFEQKVIQLIENIRKKHTPNVRKLALSGGIFANVKLNKKINELDWIDEIFVLPPMGDEGLALGCAISVHKRLNPDFKPFRLENAFLGNEFTEEEVLEAGKDFKRYDLSLDFISDCLMDKKIMGLYQGKSEHGPRALGNRSIICDCRYKETYDILNGKLERNDYMPFAPAVLEEDIDTIFHLQKSRYASEFMTILVNTKEEWKDKIPTVVHPKDKTARIQLVTNKSNPLFYDILKAYKSKSGIGILVNTSFNVHNEPIVDKPEDAFNHLRTGIVDFLITPFGIFSID